MFDEFADSENLSCETELILQRRPWLNGAGGIVRAVEVPGIESGEVLYRSQDFVPTDCRRNVSQIAGTISKLESIHN